LPKILSKEDVVRLTEHAPTYKYQVFLTFMYATGLRMSEALNLRMQDINSDHLQIRIEKGKGGKDRYIYRHINHPIDQLEIRYRKNER
jgi:integrase